jgi:hypothetical protein
MPIILRAEMSWVRVSSPVVVLRAVVEEDMLVDASGGGG